MEEEHQGSIVDDMMTYSVIYTKDIHSPSTRTEKYLSIAPWTGRNIFNQTEAVDSITKLNQAVLYINS